MGAWGGRHPRRSYYASDRQIAYLRDLLRQAFAARIPSRGFDVHHLDGITGAEASAEIDRLKAALAAAKAGR